MHLYTATVIKAVYMELLIESDFYTYVFLNIEGYLSMMLGGN